MLKTNSINLLTGSYHKISSLLGRLTGTLSGYFLRIFSPSARRFSKGCSSLYSHFIYLLWKGLNTSRLISEAKNNTVPLQNRNKMALNVCFRGGHVTLCSYDVTVFSLFLATFRNGSKQKIRPLNLINLK